MRCRDFGGTGRLSALERRLRTAAGAALCLVAALMPMSARAAETAPVKQATVPATVKANPSKTPPVFRNADGQVFGFVKSTAGAWSTVCEQDDKTRCVMLQRVASEERPEVELSVTIFQYLDATTKKKASVMRVSLPLDANVFLPAGLGLYVDSVDLGRSYFVSCSSFGCFSDAVLDDSVVQKLKAGKQAVFTVFLSREEDGMGIPVDLTGFAKGMEGLQ